MSGYIFFGITVLFYVGLALFTASKPTLAGDQAMGYGLGLFFLGIGFVISSLVLTILVLLKGGFNGVTASAGLRTGLVILSWLVTALTIFFCAVFKWEWHSDTEYPSFLHVLAVYHGQIWITLLWLAACFFSLNTGWQETISPQVIKIPFWIALSIGSVYSAGLLIGYMRDAVKTAQTEQADQMEQADRWHQKNLEEIAAHEPSDPIITMLSFSTRYRPDDIRQAAIAKIKTHTDWEAEILELLKDKRAYREVYYFLDGNAVEHPELFAGPLNQSILWTAASIKADINDSNNLQHWSFDTYLIDRLLRAIDDQFLNQKVDFYPNVVKLQQALNTPPPERFKGVHFTATDVVNDWLRKHRR